MQIARVLGAATSTVKHASLRGSKLLLVQPLTSDRSGHDGDPLLVIDASGAGRGDVVLITSDGRYTRELLGAEATPARWTVLGIED